MNFILTLCVAISCGTLFLGSCKTADNPDTYSVTPVTPAIQAHWTAQYKARIAGTWSWKHEETTWGSPNSGTWQRNDTTFTLSILTDTLAVIGTDTLSVLPLRITTTGAPDSANTFYEFVYPNSMHRTYVSLQYSITTDSLSILQSFAGSGGGTRHQYWRK